MAQCIRVAKIGLTSENGPLGVFLLVAACLLPDTGARNIDSLLNQQILPVLSQLLLGRMSEQQRTTSLTLGWDEEEGIALEFGEL